MSEYFITKRETCWCVGSLDQQPKGWECRTCHGLGYIETQVPLLDVLKKVRFDDIYERGFVNLSLCDHTLPGEAMACPECNGTNAQIKRYD